MTTAPKAQDQPAAGPALPGLLVDPEEELVVVYLTNLIPAGGIDDHGKLRALIYQAIMD